MAPTPPALPAGTALGLSYEYGIDINLGTTAAPVWQSVRRISGVQVTTTPKTQSAQTYDDFGADNADVVGSNTNLTFAVQANRSTSTGLYLPEVEAMLLRARPSSKGESAVVEARWYHKPAVGTANPNDAGQGFFTVAKQRANTGSDGAVEVLNITLTGKGQAAEIANPFTGWDAAVPTISSATPSGAGAAELITVVGTGFIGTTGVTIGGTAAAEFTVLGDSTLVASLPSGSAGSAAIIVTNAEGASSAFAYTRAVWVVAAVDFTEWAQPDLEVRLRGVTYTVAPRSVAEMRPILALVASAEVRLGLAAAELAPDLEEISKVLDGTPLAELTLGAEVYARMEADGVSPITRDRVGYYAMFYWARGKERADKIAAAMWTPDREISEDDVPGEARRR